MTVGGPPEQIVMPPAGAPGGAGGGSVVVLVHPGSTSSFIPAAQCPGTPHAADEVVGDAAD
jgi:hypothetical protein